MNIMQSVHVALAQSLRVVGRRGLQDSEDACPIVTMGSPSLSDDAVFIASFGMPP